jgi:predicted metalloendopeptidase
MKSFSPPALVNADFDFYGKTLGGAQQLELRGKPCVNCVDNDLVNAWGQV